MFVGIGLIGMLTSTITNFFVHDKEENTKTNLDKIYQQNLALMREVKGLKEEIKRLK